MNHSVKCLNPQCVGGRIETTMEGDSGYSSWTVLEDGFVEFKCHGCGKFGSTDKWKVPNELDNFEVTCNMCSSVEWEEHIQHIQDEEGDTEPTHIRCKKCGVKSTYL